MDEGRKGLGWKGNRIVTVALEFERAEVEEAPEVI